MAVAPSPGVVVLEEGPIGAVISRMLDPPGIELRVIDLLVEVPVHPHIGFTLDSILAQGIGFDLGAESSLASIRHQVGLPQPGFTVRQYDLRQLVEPFGQAPRGDIAGQAPAPVHHPDQGHIQRHRLQMRPSPLDIADCP